MSVRGPVRGPGRAPARIVFLPSTVLLVPGVSGRTRVLGELREALLTAVRGGSRPPWAVLTTGEATTSLPDAGAWVRPVLEAHGVPAALAGPGLTPARGSSDGGPADGVPADGVAAAGWLAGTAGPVPALQLDRRLDAGRAAALARAWFDALPVAPATLLVAGDGPAALDDASPLPFDPVAADEAERLFGLLAGGRAEALGSLVVPPGVRADGAAAWAAAARLAAGRRIVVPLARHTGAFGVDYPAVVWDLS